VRWGCAGLVPDSGTDVEQGTNVLLQKQSRGYMVTGILKNKTPQIIVVPVLNLKNYNIDQSSIHT
jgi:hypothetical protein